MLAPQMHLTIRIQKRAEETELALMGNTENMLRVQESGKPTLIRRWKTSETVLLQITRLKNQRVNQQKEASSGS